MNENIEIKQTVIRIGPEAHSDLNVQGETLNSLKQIYTGGGVGEGHTRTLKLNLAGGERLVLHDHGAAGGQHHDVELLLLLVRLLVPVPGHLCVVGGDQGHLRGAQTRSGDVRTDKAEKMLIITIVPLFK